jgi:hypothetical protein
MVMREVSISIPDEMVVYVTPKSKQEELKRNALILYPYISNDTISHGRAAEILGISKCELIDIYDDLGLAYLSMDISEVKEEIEDWNRRKNGFQ